MHKYLSGSVLSASMLATSALAQDALLTTQNPNELRGDWIIGALVRSMEDETIGNIDDIIIDEADGQITAAVVSVGGFLGIGAKSIAIDWSDLNIDWDGDEINVALTREEAEEAPEYQFRDREFAPMPEDPGLQEDTPPDPID